VYVPEEWVRPADGGVERLVNVYLSMGVTPPKGLPTATVKADVEAAKETAKAAPRKRRAKTKSTQDGGAP
ncbi:MAG: hypothetical protein P8Y82_04000, partial [Methyloceanibacter sp.]